MTNRPEFRLTLRPEPGASIPAIIRLRRALKTLLRSYGLRCTEVTENNPNPQPAQEKSDDPETVAPSDFARLARELRIDPPAPGGEDWRD